MIQKSFLNRDLKKNCLLLLSKLFAPFIILISVGMFFYPVFLRGLVPIPSDIIVGLYYPWFDDTRGYTVGVPVKNNIPSDIVSLIYPQKLFAANLIRESILPFWNNLIFAGTPLIANFQSSVFYPLNILWFFMSTLDAWVIQVVLQPIFGMFFAYLLYRNWGLTKLSSLFGSVAFSFSGFLIVWLEYNVLYHVMYWLPFTFFLIDRYLKTKFPLYLVGLSLTVCLTIFAGYPQFVLYIGLAVFIYIFFVGVKNMFLFSFYAFVGLGLAGMQLFPGYELLNMSNRGGDNTVAAGNSSFIPLKHLVGFLIPDYFGNPSTLNWWGVGIYDNFATFVGVTTFVLSLIAIYYVRHRREVRYAIVLLIVSLLLSVRSPLSNMISDVNFLGLRAAVASRSLFLSAFAFSILGAFGIEQLRENIGYKQLVRILYLPAILLISISAATYIAKIWLTNSLVEFTNYKDAFDIVNLSVRNLHIGFRNSAIPFATFGIVAIFILLSRVKKIRLLSLSVLLLILYLELFRFGHKYITFSKREYLYPKSKITDYLVSKKNDGEIFRVLGGDVIPMNMLAPYGIETANGYEALYPINYARFLGAVTSGDTGNIAGRYGDIRRFDSDYLDKANVKYILGLKRDKIAVPSKTGSPSYRFDLDKLKPVFEDGSVVIFENIKAFPRAYVSLDGHMVDASVNYVKYSPNSSVIKINSPVNGLLVISDLFYPGWVAEVNGLKTDIIPVDDVFRGIKIDKGEHMVEMEYKPKSFFTGLKISVISLIILTLSQMWFFIKRKQRV